MRQRFAPTFAWGTCAVVVSPAGTHAFGALLVFMDKTNDVRKGRTVYDFARALGPSPNTGTTCLPASIRRRWNAYSPDVRLVWLPVGVSSTAKPTTSARIVSDRGAQQTSTAPRECPADTCAATTRNRLPLTGGRNVSGRPATTRARRRRAIDTLKRKHGKPELA